MDRQKKNPALCMAGFFFISSYSSGAGLTGWLDRIWARV